MGWLSIGYSVLSSKLGRILTIVASVLLGLLTLVVYIVHATKAADALKVTQEALNDYKLEAKARAEVNAMSDAAVRERLRARWSRQ